MIFVQEHETAACRELPDGQAHRSERHREDAPRAKPARWRLGPRSLGCVDNCFRRHVRLADFREQSRSQFGTGVSGGGAAGTLGTARTSEETTMFRGTRVARQRSMRFPFWLCALSTFAICACGGSSSSDGSGVSDASDDVTHYQGTTPCDGKTCQAGEACVVTTAGGGACVMPDDAGLCPNGNVFHGMLRQYDDQLRVRAHSGGLQRQARVSVRLDALPVRRVSNCRCRCAELPVSLSVSAQTELDWSPRKS